MILETERLVLRRFTPGDASMILALLNDPLWIRFIGERNVRTLEDARAYLEKGPLRSYAEHGYGLWLVERKSDGAAMGMCGLVKREALPDADLGFAFLERYRGMGYALEAAAGTLRHAREALGLERILAIATPANERSGRLLARLGFVRERALDWNGDPDDPVDLWAHRGRDQAQLSTTLPERPEPMVVRPSR
jgi:[ribosomal protein S5]-alanine N-acetyltransferase